MTRMLQALRQIEARTSSAPRSSEAAWSAGGPATSWPETVASPPSMGDAMGSAQQLWEQVEAALAAEATVTADLPPTPAIAPDAAVADPSLPLPPSALPLSQAADPYSRLADAILADLSPVDAAVLMFTGVEEDGKGAVVARLAAALAPRVAGGVLAVDGNFAAAELAAHLSAESSGGLPEVLAGTASWHDVVRPTVMHGLSVLPGGILAGGRSAGFEPSALGPLLAEFREHYHLVLIEAASLRHPEAAPLAAWCDARLPRGAAGMDDAAGDP